MLDELPDSLDETYSRILREIKRSSRDRVKRLLQCLTVAIRPLRVEELAELLAYDFDAAEGFPDKVWSRVQGVLRQLFDASKPHFSARQAR